MLRAQGVGLMAQGLGKLDINFFSHAPCALRLVPYACRL
jgi:hypothetical protein